METSRRIGRTNSRRSIHDIASSVSIYFEHDPQSAAVGVTSDHSFSTAAGFEFRVPFGETAPESLEAFAKRLDKLVNDPTERAKLSARLVSLDGVKSTISQLRGVVTLIESQRDVITTGLFSVDDTADVSIATESAAGFDSDESGEKSSLPIREITIEVGEDSDGNIICEGVELTEDGREQFKKLHALCGA